MGFQNDDWGTALVRMWSSVRGALRRSRMTPGSWHIECVSWRRCARESCKCGSETANTRNWKLMSCCTKAARAAAGCVPCLSRAVHERSAVVVPPGQRCTTSVKPLEATHGDQQRSAQARVTKLGATAGALRIARNNRTIYIASALRASPGAAHSCDQVQPCARSQGRSRTLAQISSNARCPQERCAASAWSCMQLAPHALCAADAAPERCRSRPALQTSCHAAKMSTH